MFFACNSCFVLWYSFSILSNYSESFWISLWNPLSFRLKTVSINFQWHSEGGGEGGVSHCWTWSSRWWDLRGNSWKVFSQKCYTYLESLHWKGILKNDFYEMFWANEGSISTWSFSCGLDHRDEKKKNISYQIETLNFRYN